MHPLGSIGHLDSSLVCKCAITGVQRGCLRELLQPIAFDETVGDMYTGVVLLTTLIRPKQVKYDDVLDVLSKRKAAEEEAAQV